MQSKAEISKLTRRPVDRHEGTLGKVLVVGGGLGFSCASGVTVVNIDNGFGAAYAASIINLKIEHGG